MRIRPLHFGDSAGEGHPMLTVEFGCKRVMRSQGKGGQQTQAGQQPGAVPHCRHTVLHFITPENQNVNFSASCTRRGGAARTTCPNVRLLMSPSTATGPKNCA